MLLPHRDHHIPPQPTALLARPRLAPVLIPRTGRAYGPPARHRNRQPIFKPDSNIARRSKRVRTGALLARDLTEWPMPFVTQLELTSGDRGALDRVVDGIKESAARKGVEFGGPHSS